MDQMTTCTVRLESMVPVVSVVGELDIGNIRQLQDAIFAASKQSARSPIVDLTHCTYFDSQTIHELIRSKATMLVTGRVLHIVVPPAGPAKRILQIMGVTDGLMLYNRLDEAIAASTSNAPT